MKPVMLLIALLAFSMATYAQGPEWKWATTAGGVDMTTDKDGYIYLTGHVKDSVRIGSTILKSTADYDLYIAKFDPAGYLIWAKTTPGNNSEIASGIAVDNAGNIYLNASVKIIGGPFVFGGITLNTFGSDDFLFAKYDNNGTMLWAKTTGGPGLNFAFSDGISCDGNGNFVITGKFEDYCVFDNDTLHGSTISEDIVIAKYNSNGDALWYKGAGGKKSDRGFSVTADAVGNIFATGYYTDTAWFDNLMVTANDGLPHTYLTKYDAMGQLQWVKTTGGEIGANLVVDASGSIYLTGVAGSSDMFDAIQAGGTGYAFLAKYDNSGNALWASRQGRTGSGLPDIEVDPLGNVYFSADSVLTQKFNSNGQSLWEVINPKHEYSAILASDKNGNIYASGNIFGGTINIGTTTVAAPHYLARLSPFPASVPGLTNDATLNVYPNPAKDLLHIEGAGYKSFAITDVLGKTILTGTVNDNTIDIGTLSPGSYFLNLTGKEEDTSLKFTKL